MKEEELADMAENKITIVVVAILLIIVAAIIYSVLIVGTTSFPIDMLIIVLGAILGIIGAVYFLGAVVEEEHNIVLGEGEHVILQTKDTGKKAYISFPKEEDGIIGEDAPIEVDIYLTTHGFFCEPPDTGVKLIYIPLFRISQLRIQSKLGKKYIRLKYYSDEEHLDEVLIFLGDESEKWYNTTISLMQPG
ncbi:MAG: hypothetical protein ABH950_03645 [Candidatus Altiarchaeota archaeon]